MHFSEYYESAQPAELHATRKKKGTGIRVQASISGSFLLFKFEKVGVSLLRA